MLYFELISLKIFTFSLKNKNIGNNNFLFSFIFALPFSLNIQLLVPLMLLKFMNNSLTSSVKFCNPNTSKNLRAFFYFLFLQLHFLLFHLPKNPCETNKTKVVIATF